MENKELFERIKSAESLATTENNSRSYADRVLSVALMLGESLLHCGGEINRVENTIERICRAYGAKHVEVFTITSVIIAEVRMEDNSYSSQIRRVLQSEMGTDLNLLEKLNAISRRICTESIEPERAAKLIKKAREKNSYPALLPLLGAFIAAGSFAVFFGGNLFDGLAAAIVGMLITLIDARPSFMNKMASTAICSFIGGCLAYFISYLGSHLGLSGNVDMVMIGAIMLLIPGVSFGYALRDLMFGDTLSGALKIIQAILLAAMIALGYSLAIILIGGAMI